MRERDILKSGVVEEIYRDSMSRIERSTGLSCSTILAERERERAKSENRLGDQGLLEFPGPYKRQGRTLLDRKGG